MSGAQPGVKSETIILKAGAAPASAVKELTKALLTYGAKAMPGLMPDLNVDAGSLEEAKSETDKMVADYNKPMNFVGKSQQELSSLPDPVHNVDTAAAKQEAYPNSTYVGPSAKSLVQEATRLA
jgi:hypothetical protein